MHSLTICFGPTGTVWTLLFKEPERALEMHDALLDLTVEITTIADDFGQKISMRGELISAMLLEDLDISQMASIERGLHQARAQAKAQTRAMADPVIKESLRAQQQGPAVMSPMGNRFS